MRALLAAAVLLATLAAPDSATAATTTPLSAAAIRGVAWYDANTGVEPGRVLWPVPGNWTLTAAHAGQTFTDLDVAGVVDASAAPGVTFRNLRAQRVVARADTTVEHCDVHGEQLAAHWTNHDLLADGTYRFCDVHHGFRGLNVRRGAAMFDSWVHDLRPVPDGTHRESVLSNGMSPGAHLTLQRNWLEAGSWDDLTGEVALFGDFALIHDVLLTGNVLVDSGSYQLYAGSTPGKPYSPAVRVVVARNTFGLAPRSGPPGAQYGHVSGWAYGGGNHWMKNTRVDGVVVRP